MDRIQGQNRENMYQIKPVYLHILPSVTNLTYYLTNLHIIEEE